MPEPIEWQFQAGTSCAYCKDGLCQRMNQLMEDGHSQRAASRIMEEECEGKWKAVTIIRNFNNWTSESNLIHSKKTQKQNTTQGGDSKRKSKYHKFAMEKARAAIAELEQIRYDHPGREQALELVKVWITNNEVIIND